MTHEQAAKILAETWCGCTDASGLIFALERLGVLKLDKPNPQFEFLSEVAKRVGPVPTAAICDLLGELGLKVVLK